MRTLQIVHQETILQADLIISGTEAWDVIQFERRRLEGGLYFISPKDIILNKLRWRLRSQSEKQWRDVMGILKVQGERLDFEYLWEWAGKLGLSDELERVCGEAGINPPKP